MLPDDRRLLDPIRDVRGRPLSGRVHDGRPPLQSESCSTAPSVRSLRALRRVDDVADYRGSAESSVITVAVAVAIVMSSLCSTRRTYGVFVSRSVGTYVKSSIRGPSL